MKKIFAFLIALIAISCTQNQITLNDTTSEVAKFEIPYATNLTIDGDVSDWNQFTSFDLFATLQQEVASPNDFKATLQLAWTDDGLAFCAIVQDDTVLSEYKNPWATDGVELFLSPAYGNDNLLQYAHTALEVDGDGNGLVEMDMRKDKEYLTNNIKWEVKRTKTAEGYICEGLCDLSALNVTPAEGSEIGLQAFINDFDSDKKGNRYSLFYATGVHHLAKAMYPAKLVKNTSTNSKRKTETRCVLIDKREVIVKYISPVSNENVSFFQNNLTLEVPEVSEENGYVIHSLSIDANELDKSQPLYVKADGAIIEAFNLNYIELVYLNVKAPYPFEEIIRAYEANDAENPPAKNATLVVGSSSIRMWKTMKEDLHGMDVLPRGFGGSKAQDVLHYIDRIVLPYKPAKIIYYEGDNDIGSGMTPEDFIDSTKKFIGIVKTELPETDIYLLSVKPSLKRMSVWPKADQANKMMQDIASNDDKVFFIDVAAGMFDEEGNLKKEIFIRDGIHMNADGYAIWTKIIREALGLD